MRPRRGILWVLSLALVMAVMGATAAGATEPVNVYVGESTTLTLPYQFSKLALGDPTIADYVVQKNEPTGAELLINGKLPGLTNLIVWDMQNQQREVINVNVLVRDVKAYLRQIRAMIGKVEGLRFRLAGGKLFIEGEVMTTRERDLINKVVGDSPQVIKLFTISPISLKVIADTIQGHLHNPNIRVRPVNQKIALEGVAFSKEEKKRIGELAKLYYDQVVNLIQVRKAKLSPGAGDMVQVTAHFMEVKNKVIDGWGFSWLPLATGEASATNDLGRGLGFLEGTISGVISNLFPKLSVAKEHGGARVLETSSMSVRSGETATFHSGGELAIPVTQGTGSVTVEYKEYGVFLKVLPITEGDTVTMKLEVEVSAPSSATTGGNINFSKSKVTTVQYCKSMDSVAIGGLISNRDAKTFDALPPGASGALVQLYSSEDFRTERSQFVVFVTPAILKKGAAEAHQELRNIVETDFGAYQPRKK